MRLERGRFLLLHIQKHFLSELDLLVLDRRRCYAENGFGSGGMFSNGTPPNLESPGGSETQSIRNSPLASSLSTYKVRFCRYFRCPPPPRFLREIDNDRAAIREDRLLHSEVGCQKAMFRHRCSADGLKPIINIGGRFQCQLLPRPTLHVLQPGQHKVSPQHVFQYNRIPARFQERPVQ